METSRAKMSVLPGVAAAALLLVSAPAEAEDCAGGFMCANAALASISFRLVRDCPDYFYVKPDKKRELERAMVAVRKRPMAGVFTNENGEDDLSGRKPVRVSKEYCERPAIKLMGDSPLSYFLGVKAEAARRLRSSI